MFTFRFHIDPITVRVADDRIDDVLSRLTHIERLIMSTAAELAAAVSAATAQVTKIGDETRTLISKIQELQDAIAAGFTTTPEIDAAMEALKAQVQIVDDLVADTPPA